MMVDSEDYKSRLKAYTHGRDYVQMLRESPGVIVDLLRGVPDEVLHRSPVPGKWSIAEILAHLADDEIATAWRYRQMLENPGCTLPGFDQDAWAQMGNHVESNPQDSLDLYRSLRQANLRLLERLAADQWNSWGVHVERGRITVEGLARHMAGHDVNHIEQIRKILETTGTDLG